MAQAPTKPANPLIGSDRVEGTAVYSRAGARIGSVRRVMIDKVSGRVAYAIVSFESFAQSDQDTFKLPWSKLTYDVPLGGYHTDVTEEKLHAAPSFARGDRQDEWLVPEQEEELHAFFRIPPYWRSI